MRLHRPEQAINGHPQCKAHCGRIHVNGALRCVNAIVKVQRIVAARFLSHDLQRHDGDHFVRVYVGKDARAALNHINHKLIVNFFGDQRFAAFDDWLGELSVERAKLYIGKDDRFF